MEQKPAERLNPLNDYLFMKVMGEKGDEEQLLSFLNAVLRRTGKDRLVSVEILENKTFTAEVIGDKSSILDLRAVLEDRTKVNIEVQLRNLGNMDRRSLFYWSREYTKSLEAGQDYLELPNVVAINIVNFEFLPSGDFHTSFHLREDRDKELRTLPNINATYCLPRVVVYNSNPCGICPPGVLSLTSVHQLYERLSRMCSCLIGIGH
jgi:predicted transposase/invertase (TIGR01784 family)